MKAFALWVMVLVYSAEVGLANITLDTTVVPKKYLHVNTIVPLAGITYGFVALKNQKLIQFNHDIQDKLVSGNMTSVDDYLMFAPLVMDAGLSLNGFKSKHTTFQKIGLYVTSMSLSTAIVLPLKHLTKVTRPDGSADNSFPSGHTATAFATAEYFWQEYQHQNKWFASTGYVFAFATGYLRMYNNRHWFSDVVAGAGVGILSTKLVYWAYPRCQKWLFPNVSTSTVLVPFYYQNHGGISWVHSFESEKKTKVSTLFE